MTNRAKVVQCNVKIPVALIDFIDKDCAENGEFRSRSEWIVEAVRQYADFRTKMITERKKAMSDDADDFPTSSADFGAEAK